MKEKEEKQAEENKKEIEMEMEKEKLSTIHMHKTWCLCWKAYCCSTDLCPSQTALLFR